MSLLRTLITAVCAAALPTFFSAPAFSLPRGAEARIACSEDDHAAHCRLFGAVYVEEVEAFADYRVYVEDVEAFADVVVYRQNVEAFATEAGQWYFTDVEAFADFTIYLESTKAFADFSIHYTTSESSAGCR